MQLLHYNREKKALTTHPHTHIHTLNTRCQRLMRIIYMSGWYSQGWGRGHSVENCVTHWFTGSHNRSFLSQRHTLIYVNTHMHTHTHTMQSLQKLHRKSKLLPTGLNPVKNVINHLFFCLQSLFFYLSNCYCTTRVPSMTRLMTMSSCLSPGSNLELRRRGSALVFVFFCVCGRDVPRGRSVTSSLPDR